MAAGDRTKRIRDKVRMYVGVDEVKITQALIFLTIDDYQRRIAEETLCIEGSASLSVSNGTVSEPSGFYRLRFIELPDSQILQLREVDLEEFDGLEKSTLSAIQTPAYFKRWNGTITFYPNPGTASYTAWYYKIPSTNVSASVDPETPARFDDAIKYGVLSELLPLVEKSGEYYRQLYAQELGRALNSHRRTKTLPLELYAHEE